MTQSPRPEPASSRATCVAVPERQSQGVGRGSVSLQNRSRLRREGVQPWPTYKRLAPLDNLCYNQRPGTRRRPTHTRLGCPRTGLRSTDLNRPCADVVHRNRLWDRSDRHSCGALPPRLGSWLGELAGGYVARSWRARIPVVFAQCAQQYTTPPSSSPWPMIRQPQCVQEGASAWIAHSKLSKVCLLPSWITTNEL